MMALLRGGMREIQSHSQALCVSHAARWLIVADVIHNTIHCQISNLLHSLLDSIVRA